MRPIESPALPALQAHWRGGWLEGVVQCPSPNFGPRPVAVPQGVDLIVVHSISLPPGVYGGPEIAALFTNTLNWDAHPYFQAIRGLEVSSHFVIRRNGEIWQFVDADARAWHAGVSQWRGRDRCNDDSIGIELEGLEGSTFETVQYRRLAQLCQCIAARYPIAHIAGHEHIAPGRKHDPGAGFDWQHLQSLLSWPATFYPAETLAK